jgi:hypothetical protein
MWAICVSAIWLSGCAEQKKVQARKFPWGVAASARPKLVALTLPANDENDDLMPVAELDVPPPPGPLSEFRVMPVRPRVVAIPGTASDATKPEPLEIVPELTPEETVAAKEQTGNSLGIAERNIGSARGKALNRTQLDLASKVRSFIAEAREASHAGDWTRARDAAKKAEVLSEELARSL